MFFPFEWCECENDDPYIKSFTKFVRASTLGEEEGSIEENENGMPGIYDDSGVFKEWWNETGKFCCKPLLTT